MAETCAYCGEALIEYDDAGNRITRIDAKFDSDACRDRYWSDVRKIRRAYARATDAIKLLEGFSLETNEVGDVARTRLALLVTDVQRVSERE